MTVPRTYDKSDVLFGVILMGRMIAYWDWTDY